MFYSIITSITDKFNEPFINLFVKQFSKQLSQSSITVNPSDNGILNFFHINTDLYLKITRPLKAYNVYSMKACMCSTLPRHAVTIYYLINLFRIQ